MDPLEGFFCCIIIWAELWANGARVITASPNSNSSGFFSAKTPVWLEPITFIAKSLMIKPVQLSMSFNCKCLIFLFIRWACSTVMTRQNELPSLTPGRMQMALVPLWDMCNHDTLKVGPGKLSWCEAPNSNDEKTWMNFRRRSCVIAITRSRIFSKEPCSTNGFERQLDHFFPDWIFGTFFKLINDYYHWFGQLKETQCSACYVWMEFAVSKTGSLYTPISAS